MKRWLSIFETIGLAALEASPLAKIAPEVKAAIIAAEHVQGATGAEKLHQAVTVAVHAAAAARTAGVEINPIAVQASAKSIISDVVKLTNIAAGIRTHDDAPPALPMPDIAAAHS